MTATTTLPAQPAIHRVTLLNPQFHHHYHDAYDYRRHLSLPFPSPTMKLNHRSVFFPRFRYTCTRLHASIPRQPQGTCDPELRSVLELASDSELCELEKILFGPSYFSPLLKSITKRADTDYVVIGEDPEERDNFISLLESRFLYLAADARSTLRGWRPSYRNVLLEVRKRLCIPCSTKLSTEDLEVEIFLHLLQDGSSEESGIFSTSSNSSTTSSSHGILENGLNQKKVQAVNASRFGAAELYSMILKGGGMITLSKIYNLLSRNLSGKMLVEAANYQIKNEIIKKGGHLAAINLESRAALLAAKKGFAGAASQYMGLRSMLTFLGPIQILFGSSWDSEQQLKPNHAPKSISFFVFSFTLPNIVVALVGHGEQSLEKLLFQIHRVALATPLPLSDCNSVSHRLNVPLACGEHFWQMLSFRC